MVKKAPARAGDSGLIPGLGVNLEKEMATRSSILARKIPWIEESGRLYSAWGRKELDMTEVPAHTE